MYKIKDKTITLDKKIFKNYKDYVLKFEDELFNFDSKLQTRVNKYGVYKLYLKKADILLFISNLVVIRNELNITKIKAESYIKEFNNFIEGVIEK